MPQLDLASGKVPAKACCFTADVAIDDGGGDAKTKPIKLTARTGDAVDNYWWGAIVHDLGGMRVAKPTIPLDYCHDDEQVIGYADTFDTSTGDLVASGALVPYPNDPCDKATEVIYKNGLGVPYQASIFFDGPLVIEEVGQGAMSNVNGRQVEGPATIIRQWTLRGIAVCPYGVDGDTSVEMKFAKDREIPVRILNQEKNQMSVENGSEKPADEKQADASTENAATENKPADAVVDGADNATDTETTTEETTDGDEAADESAAGEQSVVKPVKGSMSDRKAEGKKFRDAFGDKGLVYFADGLSYDEAMAAFVKDVAEDNKRLSKEVADLKTQNAGLRGEKEPVSFGADPTERPAQAANKQAANADPRHKNLPEGLRKFADNVQFQNNGTALPKKSA